MPYVNSTYDWLGELIIPSFENFYNSRDYQLLYRGVNERSIVEYIVYSMRMKFNDLKNENIEFNEIFGELSIDIEYNRNFEDPKRCYYVCRQCSKTECLAHNKNLAELIPDIIIHLRNTNLDNQVAIEIKKDNARAKAKIKDKIKLCFLTCQKEESIYNYRLGYFINLTTKGINLETFQDAVCSAPQTCVLRSIQK